VKNFPELINTYSTTLAKVVLRVAEGSTHKEEEEESLFKKKFLSLCNFVAL
jgi:hypothetical protein